MLHNNISRIIKNNKYAYNIIFTKFDIYIFITTDSIGVFQLLWILVLHNKISCIISNNKYAMVQHKYKHWCLLSSVSAFLTMILKSIFG